MAIQVLTNAYLSINAVVLSDHVKSVTLSYEAEMQDASAMSVTNRKYIAGLKNWNLSVELEQDYAAGSVDISLFALVGAAAVAMILRPDAAVKSATNPEFTGNVVLESYNPVAGTVGDLAMCTATFRPAGVLGRSN
jgi:hypothetical protein